ncbi:hypothetical protein N7488_009219 [Penicillium malachiteum]|nr:hypothetical protein N7488_009219 [Penicillium malachiteum]
MSDLIRSDKTGTPSTNVRRIGTFVIYDTDHYEVKAGYMSSQEYVGKHAYKQWMVQEVDV